MNVLSHLSGIEALETRPYCGESDRLMEVVRARLAAVSVAHVLVFGQPEGAAGRHGRNRRRETSKTSTMPP